MTYAEKLKDPRWQKRRLDILSRDEFKCVACGDGTTTLHVHHKRYIKGREPWEYDDADLATRCEPCHGEEHEARTLLDHVIYQLDKPEYIRIAAALLAGYFIRRVQDEARTPLQDVGDSNADAFALGEIADNIGAQMAVRIEAWLAVQERGL